MLLRACGKLLKRLLLRLRSHHLVRGQVVQRIMNEHERTSLQHIEMPENLMPMDFGLGRSWKTGSRSCTAAKSFFGCCSGRRSEQFAEANADCRGKSRQNGIASKSIPREVGRCRSVPEWGSSTEEICWRMSSTRGSEIWVKEVQISTLEDCSWPCPWAIC